MPLFCVGVQHLDLEVGEQDRCGKLRAFSAQKGHQHDAPGNDQIDANGARESVGGLVLQGLDAAVAFQYPMPVFDAPAQAVATHTIVGLPTLRDLAGRQEALDGRGIGWR
jgi:hypothetical protein